MRVGLAWYKQQQKQEEEVEALQSTLTETLDRLESNDEQVDLLRNQLQRRDELLCTQRAGFYKELVKHKSYKDSRPPPPGRSRS